MKLLANENFPFKSVNVLKKAGFDIKAVGVECSGILDEEVIGFAQEEQRTILTFDRDYGELIFKKGLKPEKGVIQLRCNAYEPEEPGEYLVDLFGSKYIKFERMLTVISESSIRQRKFI